MASTYRTQVSVETRSLTDGIEELLNRARNAVRDFITRYRPEYLYVLVSGGKDSAAVWAIVDEVTSDYIAVFLHIAGQTHADNIYTVYSLAKALGVTEKRVVRVDRTRLIRDELRKAIDSCSTPCLLHVIVYTHRGEDFWSALLRYGYPTPFSRYGWGVRWCCGTFKHRVFNRLPYNGVYRGTPWKYGVDGVKATDSPRRRRIFTSDVITWEKTRDTYLFPIRDWTDEQVWEALRHYGLYEIVHRQYERWGRSPNCMFCPMVGRMDSIMQTVRAMPEGARRRLREILEKLLPRYKQGTYAYRSISKWLRALDLLEKDENRSYETATS